MSKPPLILLVKKTTQIKSGKSVIDYELTAIPKEVLIDPIYDCYSQRYKLTVTNEKHICYNYCDNTDIALRTLLFIME